ISGARTAAVRRRQPRWRRRSSGASSAARPGAKAACLPPASPLLRERRTFSVRSRYPVSGPRLRRFGRSGCVVLAGGLRRRLVASGSRAVRFRFAGIPLRLVLLRRRPRGGRARRRPGARSQAELALEIELFLELALHHTGHAPRLAQPAPELLRDARQ